ncbi:MAG: hypothetical protein U1F36_11200 [Planctomycetota bacterium]
MRRDDQDAGAGLDALHRGRGVVSVVAGLGLALLVAEQGASLAGEDTQLGELGAVLGVGAVEAVDRSRSGSKEFDDFHRAVGGGLVPCGFGLLHHQAGGVLGEDPDADLTPLQASNEVAPRCGGLARSGCADDLLGTRADLPRLQRLRDVRVGFFEVGDDDRSGRRTSRGRGVPRSSPDWFASETVEVTVLPQNFDTAQAAFVSFQVEGVAGPACEGGSRQTAAAGVGLVVRREAEPAVRVVRERAEAAAVAAGRALSIRIAEAARVVLVPVLSRFVDAGAGSS